MFCNKCGAFNPDNAISCTACKSILNSEKPNGVTNGEPDNPNVNSNVSNRLKSNSYLIQTILVTIFCNIAFGIAAIIFSGLTSAANDADELEKAKSYSEKTRLFCWISFFIGIVKYILVFIFIALVMTSRGYMFF